MKIYSISDLHLSGLSNKPMDIFGKGWEGHFDKIKNDWNAKVLDEDIVLICGDTSWGTDFEEGLFDLQSLIGLRGKKVFIRGNHDYWWNGITKLRDSAPDSTFFFLQNDCIKIENIIICGSRGWTCPGSSDYTEHDEKLYKREAERFKLCFNSVNKIKESGDTVIALIHYPPFSLKSTQTLFTDLFEENKVDKVVFGHIHGESFFPLRTVKNGIEYILTSCDKVAFTLQRIL
ncbi:MAG: serine/threonine protein phosphatase [Clostridiales bacterium]|nr:serine/threonine protein phosphatase [Clostridiales bacterium]